MKLQFLGTGAADWDWKNFPPGTRGSTSTLVGATCLVDAGATVLWNFERAGRRKLAAITDLLVTHSHKDHFNPVAVAVIARATRAPLRVWASEQALRLLPDDCCDKRPIQPGDVFRAAGCEVTALPANHALPDSRESAFHYVFVSRTCRLLYATDGAWMLGSALRLLAGALGGRPLDAVVWDSTCGATLHDWRFTDHNDLQMVDSLRRGLVAKKLATDRTVHIFDHIARTLWPKTPAARTRVAARYGGVLVEDGQTMTIPVRPCHGSDAQSGRSPQ